MEAIVRWLCSFYADKVTIQRHTRTVTCGDNVLLYSITLTDPKSKFTNYHENKITVLCNERNAEAVRDSECTFRIETVNSRQLNVFCLARRAGKAKVNLDLGKWYLVEDRDFDIDIFFPISKRLRNLEISCCEKPVDEQYEAEKRDTLCYAYYGIISMVTFNVIDDDESVIQPTWLYDVKIEYSNDNLRSFRLRSGKKIGAIFLPQQVGEQQMVVTLKRLSRMNESAHIFQIPISIYPPPCSSSITLRRLDKSVQECRTAGKEFTFKQKLYDIFGNPVLQDPKETCYLDAQIVSPKKAIATESVNTGKIITSEGVSFAVTVCFKIAGFRKLRLVVNSGSNSRFQDICVKVLPSTPDHFNDVRFTTHGAIDESFSADPTVVYRNQWSVLKGEMVDRYGNVVRELGSKYNIHCLQLINDEGKAMLEYEDVEFRSKELPVHVKINKTGKYNLAITLVNRNNQNQVVPLKKIQIHVIDAPLYLAGSKFVHVETCVAGKKFQVEVVPLDVFGCALPADSTTACNLTGDILNSPLKSSMNEETTNFKITKQDSDKTKSATTPGIQSFAVTACFKIAGDRKLKLVINSGSKSYCKDIYVKVFPSTPD